MNRKILLVVSFSSALMFTLLPGRSNAADPAVQATWDKLCNSCHGPDGRGVAKKAAVLKIEPVRLDLTREEAVKMSREDKKKILLAGKDKMPAYEKKLTAGDIDPLLDIVEQIQKAAK